MAILDLGILEVIFLIYFNKAVLPFQFCLSILLSNKVVRS